ncbi:MAG: 30S ribosomal protein S4 [Ruminococcus sp.]|nr:30S ribosomal protein S4 [Ruminococcus sp.]
MAVSREPILKRCRALGISPAVMGVNASVNEDKKKAIKEDASKKNIASRKLTIDSPVDYRDPNAGKRKKVSEYGLQLKEKQKLRFIYGVLEKQFHHYFELAQKMEGQAGTNLLTLLESRLDNVVFRMGLSMTRREARQLVVHGHYLVNGKRVDIPSYRVKVGDVISLKENSKKSPKFKEIIEAKAGEITPEWLEVDKNNQTAKVVRMPVKEDLGYEIEEHLIVELYSK